MFIYYLLIRNIFYGHALQGKLIIKLYDSNHIDVLFCFAMQDQDLCWLSTSIVPYVLNLRGELLEGRSQRKKLCRS